MTKRLLASLFAILLWPAAALAQDWMKPPANPFTILYFLPHIAAERGMVTFDLIRKFRQGAL